MSTPHPLAQYLADCRARKSTGAVTPETSLYTPLEVLLNAAGAGLRPLVRTYMNLKNRGGNMPDGGLFTPDQFGRDDAEAPAGQVPARGVIECKKPKDDLLAVADSDQVSRYWEAYSQVLVTNYREFVLLGREEGRRVRYEHFKLVHTEREFWTKDGAKLVAELGGPFLDFLRRCLLRPAPIREPKEVAWFLASYARDAKARMERAGDVPALANVRKALEQALGLSFDTAQQEEGARFFRSTLVQTLFYGVFSAWVLWQRAGPKPEERFDWEKARKYIRVPVLRKLFSELSAPAQLEDWKLDTVLGWAADVLNRVDRDAFFAKFDDAQAVPYFYEPFLEQFDPELRKQLGVWYTPPEIVRYMVGRVDRILRDDLNRPDGLADDSVYVLDPCCGTGAYLVEVLRRIDATLKENGSEALRAAKLKKAACERLFGFELLPAPFVVAHLQLGLELQHAGAPFDEKTGERPGVYLTNALTGWDPRVDATKSLFDEFNKEREAAEKVKRKQPILVILGNPPYNGFAGVGMAEERGLAQNYRWKAGDPADLKPQGQGLNDLYVRFFRMAERSILRELTGGAAAQGIVCFVSNYSWLDGLSFPLMREKYLDGFDAIWIDSLNGDKYKTGKLTPDGKPDPSAFSTERNREGIQVGTAVATMVRKTDHKSPAEVHYRDFWGTTKLKDLVEFGANWTGEAYTRVEPVRALGLPFRTMATTAGYTAWPLLPEVFPTNFPGIFTARDKFVVDMSDAVLHERLAAYFDRGISHSEMRTLSSQAMTDANRFSAIETREYLQKRGLLKGNVVPFAYRPFDNRWIYWEPDKKLLNEKRADYFPHVFTGNYWLAATKQNRKDFDPPILLTRHATLHIIERGANVFPMLLKPSVSADIFGDKSRWIGPHLANISDIAFDYLGSRGGVEAAPALFFHALAVLHAPRYAAENADALRQDWPRVPLPADGARLKASADLGRQVAALLDPEKPVPGVTVGKPRPELRSVGEPSKVGGGQFDPSADFEVTARWGTAGQGGVCMPGRGKAVERAYTPEERAALGDGLARLGESTFDIHLNDRAYWKNVPRAVWDYSLGGYQVLKKWLSYRESALLGRPLRMEEVEYVQHVIRRIAALRLLGPALDANYEAVKADLFPC